jgi:hypothetical protein
MARKAVVESYVPETPAEQPKSFTQQEDARRGNAPVTHVREGNVHGSIFTNHGAKGDFEAVQFQKSYQKDGETKYTDRFNKNDLQDLAGAAEKAFRKIEEIQQQRGQGQSR